MDWKKIGKKILYPPGWILCSLIIFSIVALVWVFTKKMEESPISYFVYVISFYTLTVSCMFLSVILPKKYKNIRQKIYDNPITNRYVTDAAFRTHISLYLSLAVNFLYVGVNILSYLFYRSMWFIVLACYYAILAVMRFLLLGYVRKEGIGKNRIGELKRARLCALILLMINLTLSGAVLMIIYQNKGFEYYGILIYVMAMYTFYVTIHAVIQLIKYRKYNSPVMTTTKIISFSAALVSMLSLETAMFSQFGADMSVEGKRLMIILTGAGVSITVITMSVYMMIRSAKEINDKRND